MASLKVRFDCRDPEARASEFQHHLVDKALRVQPEARGTETWLNYLDLRDDVVKKIVKEAYSWCLDRGLTMMHGPEEGQPGSATVLLVADLTRVVE